MDATASGNSRFTWTLIALHLALVIPLAYLLNIWADEASTLYTTQNGLLYALQHAAADEKQAPLYFWILSFWRDINGSIFFARLFSIICSVAAISVFAGVVSRIFERRPSRLVIAFFALHPFLVWTSLEIRVYSLVILLTVLLLRFFFDGFWVEFYAKSKRPLGYPKTLFLITAIIALYTNYYIGFMLVGLFAALLTQKKWREARRYLFLTLIAGIVFVPLILAVKSQFAANTAGFQEERSLLEGLRYLWHHFLTFLLPSEVFPDEQLSIVDIARLWLARTAVVAVGIFAVKERQRLSSRTASLGAITATISAFLLTAYFLIGSTYVEIRHASVVLVPLVLFAALVLDDLFGNKTTGDSLFCNIATALCTFTVFVFFSYAILNLYPDTAKRGDWARIGAYIQQNESANQPIVVFTTFEALALPYHYKGVNRILPDRRFFDFNIEAKFGSIDSLSKQTDFVISEIPPDATEIWLAVSDKCTVTQACVPLENFAQANYTVIREKDFYREKVRLLRKKQQ